MHCIIWGLNIFCFYPVLSTDLSSPRLTTWGFFIDASSMQFFQAVGLCHHGYTGILDKLLAAIIVSYLCTNSWTAFFNFKCD